MSKSLGNFFTLRELLAKGHSPLAMRYELLKTHYRDTLDFREDNFTANLSVIKKFQEFALDMERGAAGIDTAGVAPDSAQTEFLAALSEDLNIQNALTVVHEYISKVRSEGALSSERAGQALATIKSFDGVLGLFFSDEKPKVLPADLQTVFDERVRARQEKNFKRSDELRDSLLEKGVEVKDSKDGPTWRWR